MTETEFQSLQGLLARNDFKGALTYLFLLNRERPERATVLYHIGHVYRLLRDFDNAERFYVDAIRIEPTVARFHLALGILFQQKGNYGDAVLVLRRAIDLQPDYVNAWNSLGLTYKMSGDIAAALAAYQRGQELLVDAAFDRVKAEHPEVIETRLTEGGEKALHFTDQYFVALKRNLRRDVMYATLTNNIGSCYLEIGRTSEARAAFLEAIELIPEGVEYEPPFHNLRALDGDST